MPPKAAEHQPTVRQRVWADPYAAPLDYVMVDVLEEHDARLTVLEQRASWPAGRQTRRLLLLTDLVAASVAAALVGLLWSHVPAAYLLIGALLWAIGCVAALASVR